MQPFVLRGTTIFISTVSILSAPAAAQNLQIKFTDVDGNAFSTADGRITILVLTAQSNIDKARAVGDRTPDFCLANPAYRMLTVVAFEKNHSRPVRAMLSSLMRHRLKG